MEPTPLFVEYRILLVDDDVVSLQVMKKLVGRMVDIHTQFVVTTVSSPLSAVELLKASPNSFDVVISDVYMPVMNGFELLEMIVNVLKIDVPVALLSSGTFPTTPTGCITLMKKPLGATQVRELMVLVDKRKELRGAKFYKSQRKMGSSVELCQLGEELDFCSERSSSLDPLRPKRDSMKERSMSDGADAADAADADAAGPSVTRTRSNPCRRRAFANANVQTSFSMLTEMLEKLEKHLVPSKKEVTAMKDLISEIRKISDEPHLDKDMTQLYVLFETEFSAHDASSQQDDISLKPVEDKDIPVMLENLRHTFADQKLLTGPSSATGWPNRELTTSQSEQKCLTTLIYVDPSLQYLEEWETIAQELVNIPYYTFNVLKLAEMLGPSHCVLAVLTLNMMLKFKVLGELGIDPKKMYKYLQRIGRNMPASNTYHNAKHVADVVHSICLLMMKQDSLEPELVVNVGAQVQSTWSGVIERTSMTRIEVLAMIFAAAVHDLDHPGMNNDFMVRSMDRLAIRYNDAAVLESHSCALAFEYLQEEDYDVFSKLDKANFRRLRHLVIVMVGATDMGQHFEFVSKLSAICSKYSDSEVVKNLDMQVLKLIPEERETLFCCTLKLADLGHLRATPEVHQAFSFGLRDEFTRQGERMAELNMTVPDMCLRKSIPLFAKGQVGFFNFIGLPFIHLWSKLFPSVWEHMAKLNYAYWQKLADEGSFYSPLDN
mmetsp:Transcript_29635/g.49803  ORF Transcript_29635/g.49803 Transcript_29635/m.49803 type:complete len:718 (-) Transcript_29635:1354-3507(-)